MARKLTAKQRAFILEFPKDFNATQAAIRAGYSLKSAQVIGSENLSKPIIAEAIEAEFSRRGMSLDEALARTSSIARGKKPPGSEEEMLKTAEVIRSLELIMKHHGALWDKLEIYVTRDETDRQFQALAFAVNAEIHRIVERQVISKDDADELQTAIAENFLRITGFDDVQDIIAGGIEGATPSLAAVQR